MHPLTHLFVKDKQNSQFWTIKFLVYSLESSRNKDNNNNLENGGINFYSLYYFSFFLGWGGGWGLGEGDISIIDCILSEISLFYWNNMWFSKKNILYLAKSTLWDKDVYLEVVYLVTAPWFLCHVLSSWCYTKKNPSLESFLSSLSGQMGIA